MQKFKFLPLGKKYAEQIKPGLEKQTGLVKTSNPIYATKDNYKQQNQC